MRPADAYLARAVEELIVWGTHGARLGVPYGHEQRTPALFFLEHLHAEEPLDVRKAALKCGCLLRDRSDPRHERCHVHILDTAPFRRLHTRPHRSKPGKQRDAVLQARTVPSECTTLPPTESMPLALAKSGDLRAVLAPA